MTKPIPTLFTDAEFEQARAIVYETITPTLQHAWPLLQEALGFQCWIKHENHTPIGTFMPTVANIGRFDRS